MSQLKWDEVGKKLYQTGVDHGVLYPMDNTGAYPLGVVWNGLTGVTESPSGAEATPQYADNIKYLNLMSAEEFGGTIEAFMFPEEFEACDGTLEAANTGLLLTQQARKQFGLSYRTRLGNDVAGDSYGYLLHLVYGCLAAPSEKTNSTINDSPEAVAFSWAFTTTPVTVDGFRPTAHVIIDSTRADATKLAALLQILYGVDTPAPVVARLPMPSELITLLTPA